MLSQNDWAKLAKKKKLVTPTYSPYKFGVTSQFITHSYNEVLSKQSGVADILEDEENLSVLFGIAYATTSVHYTAVDVRQYNALLDNLGLVCTQFENFVQDEEAHTQKIISFMNTDKELLPVFEEFSKLAKASKEIPPTFKSNKTFSSIGKITNKNFSRPLTLTEDIKAGIASFLLKNPRYNSFVGDKVDIQQQMNIEEYFSKSLRIEKTSTSSGTLNHMQLQERTWNQSSTTIGSVVAILLDIMKSLLVSGDYKDYYSDEVKEAIISWERCNNNHLDEFISCFRIIKNYALVEIREMEETIHMCYKKFQTLQETIKQHDPSYECSTLVEEKMNTFFTKRKELFDALNTDLEFCEKYLSKNWEKEFQKLINELNCKQLVESFRNSSMAIDTSLDIYANLVDSDEEFQKKLKREEERLERRSKGKQQSKGKQRKGWHGL